MTMLKDVQVNRSVREEHALRVILREHALTTMYQPILSVAQKRVVGYEGLARGLRPLNVSPAGCVRSGVAMPSTSELMASHCISPVALFSWAEQLDVLSGRKTRHMPTVAGMPIPGQEEQKGSHEPDVLLASYQTSGHVIALDRLCREKCLDGYMPMHAKDPTLQLFMNLDASVIDETAGSRHLLRQVDAAGIPHENVIVEINEGRVRDLSALLRFVELYRKAGFLIALDDLGTGFNNLDRISLLKPDLIKLDRSLVQGIDASFHKQEVFRCLSGLAGQVGALVVAEGVETQDELFTAIRCGAQFIQGYYFSKPELPGDLSEENLTDQLDRAATGYVCHATQRMNREREIRLRRDRMMFSWMEALWEVPATEREATLATLVSTVPAADFECAYLLDTHGMQTTDTLFGEGRGVLRARGHVFTPTHAGADNSMKRYFHELMNAGTGRYVSEPYVSHATGTVCVTHSRLSESRTDVPLILCMDFIHE